MIFKKLWAWAAIVSVPMILLLSIFFASTPDYCRSTRQPAYMSEFLELFSHPLFLCEESKELKISYEADKYKVFASYKLNPGTYEIVEKEKCGTPFCPTNSGPLKVKIITKKGEWCFIEQDLKGGPDKVGDYRFGPLPRKTQKKLMKKLKKGMKILRKVMECRIEAHFGLR